MQQLASQGHLLLFGGIFLLVFSVVMGVALLASPRSARSRLQQIAAPAGGVGVEEESAGSQWVKKIVEISKPISKLSLPKNGWEKSLLRVRFMNAGWRSPSAPSLYFAAKTVLAMFLPLVTLYFMSANALAKDKTMVMAVVVVLGGLGYYLPNMVLQRKILMRQRTIFEDFPDALDLLTVCVEAGLGLDAALMRVTQEIHVRSPVLADEFNLLLLEMRSGFAKEQALRNLALRTGVEDIDNFVSMLIQAERFGTSIGESLRALSDMLRTKRRMRAEEQAAKIALKLLFPLIFFIFPTMLLVLLGPAFIQIYRVLVPTLSGIGG